MVSALREKCDIQTPCYCHLEQQGYELHGTSTHTCKLAEDREGSKEQMAEVQDRHHQSAGIDHAEGKNLPEFSPFPAPPPLLLFRFLLRALP